MSEEENVYGGYHDDTENDENFPTTTERVGTSKVTARPPSMITDFLMNYLKMLTTYKTIQLTTPASEITAENYNDLEESSTLVSTTTDFTQVFSQTIQIISNRRLVYIQLFFILPGGDYYGVEHRNNARGGTVLSVDLSRGTDHRKRSCHH